jgi:hypothetical protein
MTVIDCISSAINCPLTRSNRDWMYYCGDPWVHVNSSTKCVYFATESDCNLVADRLGELVEIKGVFYLKYKESNQ